MTYKRGVQMKKMLIVPILCLVLSLTACVSYYHRNLPKSFTKWTSMSDLLSFETQGLQSNFGFGILLINQVEQDVYVLLNVATADVIIFDEILSNGSWHELIRFQIQEGSLDGLTMTLKTDINDTGDTSYDNLVIDMTRRDLDEDTDVIDAKYFFGTSWINETEQWYFETIDPRRKLYNFLPIIYIMNEKYDVVFEFEDNQRFTIYHENQVLLTGSYETTFTTITLNFDPNDFFIQTIELVATISASPKGW